MLILDNTKRSCYTTCPRKYYYSFIKNLRSNNGSNAIRYGVCFHVGMDTFYTVIKEKGFNNEALAIAYPAAIIAMKKAWTLESEGLNFWEDYRNIDNLLQAFTQYVSIFKTEHSYMQVLETERTFNITIEMPQDLYHGVPNFIFAGKIDGEIMLNGQRWNREYKTTSQPIILQEKRLHRNPQFIGYDFASELEGHEVTGTMITFHHISARKGKSGDYGKLSLDFKNVPQIFSPEDKRNWLESFRETAFNIYRSMELNNWPMNMYSCHQFGLCSFDRLCSQGRPLGEEILDDYNERLPWDKEITKSE